MPGVCPKCVEYHSEETCPECGSPLLSPAQWKQQRDLWLYHDIVPDDEILIEQEQQDSEIPSAPAVSVNAAYHRNKQGKSELSLEEKKDFVFGFFVSALLFFFAFLTSYIFFLTD